MDSKVRANTIRLIEKKHRLNKQNNNCAIGLGKDFLKTESTSHERNVISQT